MLGGVRIGKQPVREQRDRMVVVRLSRAEESLIRMGAEVFAGGNVSEFIRGAACWMADPDNRALARWGSAQEEKRLRMEAEVAAEVVCNG